MKNDRVNIGAIKAITDLLKIERRKKKDLFDLLAGNFSNLEIDKALGDALMLGYIKKPALIKERHHEHTIYELVVR